MKVAVITMHAARNYGAVLQTYALQKKIEDMGNECVIMDYRLPNQSTKGYLLNINAKFRKNVVTKAAYLAKTIVPKYCTTKLFGRFQKRRLHLSAPIVCGRDGIHGLPKADVYCVGSDQVWNPRANSGFNQMYFLEGMPGRKVSYACSIGLSSLTEAEAGELSARLQPFSHISVRELSSLPLLEKMGVSAECVLDPTLLLRLDEWEAFAGESISGKPYLLVYFFGNPKEIMALAKKIAKEKGLEIRRIAVDFEKFADDEVVERLVTPERFVALFAGADFVITNSFHGTVFSINFRKQFLSYPTTEQNARFESVFDMFDLHSRSLRELDRQNVLGLEDIAYASVCQKLEEMRESSTKYLQEALNG